jgi:hypothetical protein
MSKLLRMRSAWDIVDMPSRALKTTAHDVVNAN